MLEEIVQVKKKVNDQEQKIEILPKFLNEFTQYKNLIVDGSLKR